MDPGRAGVHVAEMQEDLAREQVAIFTALTYLEVLRSDRALLAAQADVDLAQALLVLAQDQRTAGIATGVDVTRAETRLAQQQLRLAQAQTALEEARLQFQRVVGLPLGSQLTLTDPLRFSNETLPAIDSAVAQAEQDRPEVRIAAAQLTLLDYQRRAVPADGRHHRSGRGGQAGRSQLPQQFPSRMSNFLATTESVVSPLPTQICRRAVQQCS